MEYTPGKIILYKEESGFKRKLYGIVTEQINSNCIRIMTELKNEPMLDLFLDPKTTSCPVNIEKIVKSYKHIPEEDEQGRFSPQRQYLREIAHLIYKTNRHKQSKES